MPKMYLLMNELGRDDYADFAHIGTWEEFREPCEVCQKVTEKLVEPLRIEWDYGGDIVGDFSYCGYTIIVTDRVKDFLEKNNYNCRFGTVIVEKTRGKKRGKLVPYPYEGPHLNWMMPQDMVNLDIEINGLSPLIDCPKCGHKQFFRMDGLVIPKLEVEGSKMFRIKQFGLSKATFITEETLQEMLAQKFTNFWYYEAGKVI